jgi:hypothetical protein
MPLLTVIIVSWKVRDLLRQCLRSLFAESRLTPGQMQVMVVDNASGDGTGGMIRREFPAVTLIESEENLGFGRANTLAFERTESPFVLLLNPDTVVADAAVDRLLAHMQARPEVAAMGCRLANGDGSLQRWTGGRFPTLANTAAHYLLPPRLLASLGRANSVYLTEDVAADCEVDWVSGAVMLLRRDRVPAPLFDPSYWMYGEDMDLCARIAAGGGRVVYSPVATITHFQGASMRQQTGEVLLTSLKGIRQFYGRRAGPLRLRLFDLITFAGFGLRWATHRIGGGLRPDAARAARAQSSAEYAQLAFRLLRS